MIGRRKRVIEKFLTNSEVFSDLDLLEMLLFFTIPRKDTRALARELLLDKKSLKVVLTESQTIKNITNNTKAFLKLIYITLLNLLEPKSTLSNDIHSRKELIEYFRCKITWKNYEELYVVFLNARNNIIEIEMMFKGTVDHIVVNSREIIKKVIDYSAVSIILVHNHPSGDPSPSRQDIDLTNLIKNMLQLINTNVKDHIIVTQDKFFSFADHGMIS